MGFRDNRGRASTGDHSSSSLVTARCSGGQCLRTGSRRWAEIDALYDRLAVGIRNNAYAVVSVEYDTVHGYPMRATVDRDVLTSDDELYIAVSHFEILR